jgi:putative flippase GtrA
MSRSGFWFLVVGTSAALTHMAVFALVQHAIWPELANALGFVVAFCVSFAGHRLLSFQDAGTSVRQSLGRFAVTALLGFGANELVFVALLRGLLWPSLLALFVAMVLAAVQTYLLSRFWAFKRDI